MRNSRRSVHRRFFHGDEGGIRGRYELDRVITSYSIHYTKLYDGVTREITSGLVLNIDGWVSGDGMITTTVNASVSKRGADVRNNFV